jgi:hypothetical protein
VKWLKGKSKTQFYLRTKMQKELVMMTAGKLAKRP